MFPSLIGPLDFERFCEKNDFLWIPTPAYIERGKRREKAAN